MSDTNEIGGKVLVFKDTDGDWRWRRIAANGEPIATSGEGYTRKHYCQSIAERAWPGVEIVVEDGSE